MKLRGQGAYIVKAAESYSQRVEAKAPPEGWLPPVPTEHDRALARAVLRAKTEEIEITDDMIEAAASELALIDGYDPNAVTVAGWATITEGYRDEARRVLSAALNQEEKNA